MTDFVCTPFSPLKLPVKVNRQGEGGTRAIDSDYYTYSQA